MVGRVRESQWALERRILTTVLKDRYALVMYQVQNRHLP